MSGEIGGQEVAPETAPWWSVSAVMSELSNDVTQKLAQWQQGHILGPLPATWLAPTGLDQVTQCTTTATSVKPYYSHKVTMWSIVVSQTCDIVGTGTGARHPFVLVAPLMPSTVLQRSDEKLARAGAIPYLFPTLQPYPEEGEVQWFADLRLLVPVSKGVLLEKDPVIGLAGADEIVRFGTALGHKFRRPAVQDVLSEELPHVIDKHIKDTGARKSAYTQVEHVRLTVARDDLLAAIRVNLLVLGKVDLTEAEQELWRKWEPKGSALLKPCGIELGPTVFSTPEVCRASTYREAVPLRIDSLGTPHWY